MLWRRFRDLQPQPMWRTARSCSPSWWFQPPCLPPQPVHALDSETFCLTRSASTPRVRTAVPKPWRSLSHMILLESVFERALSECGPQYTAREGMPTAYPLSNTYSCMTQQGAAAYRPIPEAACGLHSKILHLSCSIGNQAAYCIPSQTTSPLSTPPALLCPHSGSGRQSA